MLRMVKFLTSQEISGPKKSAQLEVTVTQTYPRKLTRKLVEVVIL